MDNLPSGPIVWATLFTAGGAYEAYGIFNDRKGDTLSECTRKLFRVQTRVGKIAFTGAYVSFSAWFIPHIAAKAAHKAAKAAAALAD